MHGGIVGVGGDIYVYIRGIIHAVRICIYAYGCGQILELHTEVVEFIGGEEDHVEDLYHEGGKGKLLLGVEDL